MKKLYSGEHTHLSKHQFVSAKHIQKNHSYTINWLDRHYVLYKPDTGNMTQHVGGLVNVLHTIFSILVQLSASISK